MSQKLIRVADYVAEALARHGIRHVFMITGGGSMHLNDAIARCPELAYVCCHHEQACAMAAASYYRLANRLAAVNVTTGPGGTNALTGVFGAYVDSLGMVVVSGQVRTETLVVNSGLPLRQMGDQEVDIVRIAAPITKYAVLVNEPKTIRYHLERAIHLARTGRPGPTWVDIPVNIQGARINPDDLPAYDPAEDAALIPSRDVQAPCAEILARLARSCRPVLLVGAGVRLAGAVDDLIRLVDRWRVPVVTAFNGHDLITSDHPCYVGRQGSVGDRAGNWAVQNADFLLVLGCRLNIRQLSYAWQHFARAAYRIMVDIDATELRKPTFQPDLPVHADVADVLHELLRLPAADPASEQRAWLAWCQERRRKYPVILPVYRQSSQVNPYCFGEALFEELGENAIVVTGDGTAFIIAFQTARTRRGQRLYSDSGCAPMGFDLPGAIGAHYASGGQSVVCLAGDGSIMLNLQELQTIAGLKLPIKVFVLNNNGYVSMRQTQANFFKLLVGCGPESGVTFPDFARVAAAFDIPFRRCGTHAELPAAIRATLDGPGPQMCEVILDVDQPFAPKSSSRQLADGRIVTAPLEDMAPFLDRNEFLDNMLIPPVAE